MWSCVTCELRPSLRHNLMKRVYIPEARWCLEWPRNVFMSQEYIWSCVRQHENQTNNPTRSLFVGSSKRQWGGSFTHCATYNGCGRACNMKVFVLGSELMWWQHILMSNSWPSRCPSCDNPVRPCFHSVFRRRWERHVTCCKNDWFSKVKTRKPVVNFTWDDTFLSKLHPPT